LPERRRDALAATIGLLTFLGGVGLIIATFALAQGMFSVSPDVALGIDKDKALDLNGVLAAGMFIVMKVLLLVVMAGFGSAIASRGIKLYLGSGTPADRKPETPPEEPLA
jgi:hypothetical protein